MKRYSQHQIKALLDKFMDGQTTVEEEALLADYFRGHDVPAEWEDYRDMFSYFDRGMEGELVPKQQSQASLTTLMGRRWWSIAAAAAITAAVVGTVVLYRPQPVTQPEITEVPTLETPEQDTSIEETQDDASLQTTPEPPAETQNLASQAPVRSTHPARPAHPARSSRDLKAENAKLARENERLQRELADLKRRSFIIDLEANGYKAVQDEDGNIVLIDIEQELENELNNKLTTNIPAL